MPIALQLAAKYHHHTHAHPRLHLTTRVYNPETNPPLASNTLLFHVNIATVTQCYAI